MPNARTEFGNIRIDRPVIANVASIAASETSGVLKMGSSSIKDLLDFLRGQKRGKGVTVQLRGNDEVNITIDIVVAYGAVIPEVAREVQERVKRAVEEMLGLNLIQVDVNIHGVETKKTFNGIPQFYKGTEG